ncbi:uncharacterized protein LOC144881523 [Branchiostoma floridae x Branchiostoma japonicum]
MASVLLLAVLVLCGTLPTRAQDTTSDQPGFVLREFVDKGYCTYTYIVPPGRPTEGCLPPGQTTTSTAVLERRLAETEEETGRLKDQVDRLSSMVETLLSRVDSLSEFVTDENPVDDAPVPSTFTCTGKQPGMYADPADCSMYYECVLGHPVYHRPCAPGGVVFDPERQICNWPWNVSGPCRNHGK